MAKANEQNTQATDNTELTDEKSSRFRDTLAKLHRDDRGTTSLEWALLLGAIAIPSIFIFTMSLNIIVDYYRMMTQLSAFPFP